MLEHPYIACSKKCPKNCPIPKYLLNLLPESHGVLLVLAVAQRVGGGQGEERDDDGVDLPPVVLDGDDEAVGQVQGPLLGVEGKVLEDEVELEDGLERGLCADLDELRPRAVGGALIHEVH